MGKLHLQIPPGTHHAQTPPAGASDTQSCALNKAAKSWRIILATSSGAASVVSRDGYAVLFRWEGSVRTTQSKAACLICSRKRLSPGRRRLAPLWPSMRKIGYQMEQYNVEIACHPALDELNLVGLHPTDCATKPAHQPLQKNTLVLLLYKHLVQNRASAIHSHFTLSPSFSSYTAVVLLSPALGETSMLALVEAYG